MKKEELIQAIDSVQPDIHMKTRLNAKIKSSKPADIKPRKLVQCITALCLAAAVIFGAGMVGKTPADVDVESGEASSQNSVSDIMKAFIVVASAADAESGAAVSVNKTLEINEAYPYGVHLKIADIRGLSDADKKNLLNELNDELAKYCNSSDFSQGISYVSGTDTFYLSLCSINEFRLDLEKSENIKSVNVKNTSPYGQMVYSPHKPTFSAPKHGNDITISGEDFDRVTSGFYWDHTEEMEKALEANLDLPFSAFNDVITFTVEYNDGAKAVGVVELNFDSDGNAAAVCKSYDYQKAGDNSR